MDQFPALLSTIASELPSCTDAHRIYDLNVQLSELGAPLSSNGSDALSLRRQFISLPATAPTLLNAWRILSARLEKEDETNLAAREAAAASILDKLHRDETAPRPERAGSEVTSQVYEMIVQSARLTRDLLPGVTEAKVVVLPCEPYLRSVMYRLTTFDRIKDTELIPAHRAILQVLSNLIAPVDKVQQEWVEGLWQTYNLGSREDAVMQRALDSDDPMTVMSCIMLCINFIRADERLAQSMGSPKLRPLVAKLLDKIGWYSDAESGSLEERCFHLGYQLFSMLFHHGLQGSLFDILASPNEPVTPSQTTLLQLLDGYHHNSEWDAQQPTASTHEAYAFLIPAFHDMATYAIAAMTPSVAPTEAAQQTLDDDPRLPKVFEACIVACQCMITVCLAETEHPSIEVEGLLQRIRTAKQDQRSFIEVLVDLLRTTEAFIPRVKPFRPNDPTRSEPDDASGMAGFATLKRDLVQLAGLLANDDQQTQNQIRECGGMQVILSMCVTDDRNPLIREYALLAVRNLMINNVANQALIKEMDPVGIVGPDGELREMPARMGAKD